MGTTKNIVNTLKDKSLKEFSTSKYENSIHGLIASLKTINTSKINTFLIEFNILIENIDMFLVDPYLFQYLYKAWLYNENIFQWFIHINNKIHVKNKTSNAFWAPYITHSIITKKKVQQLYYNVDFIEYLIKKNLIHPSNFEGFNSLISIILSCNVDVYNNELKNLEILIKEHKLIIHWFHKLSRKENSNTLCLEVYNRFSKDIKLGTTYSQIIKVVKKLDCNLDSNYMLLLNRYDFEKLAWLYKKKPILFDGLKIYKNEIKTKEDLFKSLFKKYKISTAFIYRFFMQGKSCMSAVELNWFEHVLDGKSLLTLPDVPFCITKKAALTFFQLEGRQNFTLFESLFFCMLTTRGVDSDEFKTKVIKLMLPNDNMEFMIKYLPEFYQKGVDSDEIEFVLDYLREHYMRTYTGQKLVFKEIKAFKEMVFHWCSVTNFYKSTIKNRFSNYPNIQYNKFNYFDGENKFSITIIKNWREIKLEALQLCHCVASYHSACRKGDSQIFSMKKKKVGLKPKNIITIEVKQNTIIEVRGFKNRPASNLERNIINSWANENSFLLNF